MNFPYFVVLAAVLIVSPLVLKLASNQKKEAKQLLRLIYILILIVQILLGFFNWENFLTGRSGYELSLSYPDSLLGCFFIISALQIFLLRFSKFCKSMVVVLNFINTILIFIGLGKLSGILEFQAVSLWSISAVFLVLAGNVMGLVFLNKDGNLFKKYL